MRRRVFHVRYDVSNRKPNKEKKSNNLKKKDEKRKKWKKTDEIRSTLLNIYLFL